MSPILENLDLKDLKNNHPSDIAEVLSELNEKERVLAFLLLPGELKSEVFTYFNYSTQEELLKKLGSTDTAEMLENMAPDDRTEIFENFPDLLIKESINLLSPEEKSVALNLLGYPEKSIARLMTPYYIQCKKGWTIKQALENIKRYGKKAETLNHVYVVDKENKLIDDIRIGKLLMANEDETIESLMDYQFLSLTTTMSRDEAIEQFNKYDRAVMPVVSEKGVLVGIVTFDDIFDEIERRDTEDIQKFGGLEALELSYTETPLLTLVRKRASVLLILFLGEMLTASAMGYFEEEIATAVVLALFIPLIISSGGNSGSQAATLIVRAMAIKELGLRDWWYVMRKEVLSGVMLGLILGAVGFLRIIVWQQAGFYDYGEYAFLIGLTVGFSLIGIVLWGTLSGSMIPFLLQKLGLDPATSSAPFVATLVDVTGLIIYFTIAASMLSGTLL
ncbi:magnesium transporter [Pontibacter ummariensis]|uniref:Magnesium transporter MgtE n=1 Tax=Pontibacter ummariensis TaxID=1610492 RepID=A0A239BWE3_9BACT|nr:magnesium transporter [Pontibacter ummariensis]PRY15580.1 magnesium transporter [Pontibacter ummariensis]SNS12226.1 magnesium transporter [Pontibacter ummariensis]